MRGVHKPRGKLLTIILLLYLCQRETNRVKSSVAKHVHMFTAMRGVSGITLNALRSPKQIQTQNKT